MNKITSKFPQQFFFERGVERTWLFPVRALELLIFVLPIQTLGQHEASEYMKTNSAALGFGTIRTRLTVSVHLNLSPSLIVLSTCDYGELTGAGSAVSDAERRNSAQCTLQDDR